MYTCMHVTICSPWYVYIYIYVLDFFVGQTMLFYTSCAVHASSVNSTSKTKRDGKPISTIVLSTRMCKRCCNHKPSHTKCVATRLWCVGRKSLMSIRGLSVAPASQAKSLLASG